MKFKNDNYVILETKGLKRDKDKESEKIENVKEWVKAVNYSKSFINKALATCFRTYFRIPNPCEKTL